MAAANLPLVFGAVLAGAVVIEYGTKSLKTAFNGGGAASGTSGGAVADVPGTGATYGQISYSQVQAIGKSHGWTQAQIDDWFHNLIPSESNGTIADKNPGSDAYGIAQFINGPSEYATYGGNATSVVGQLTAMANYIAGRYGNPSNAWTFHKAHNWY